MLRFISLAAALALLAIAFAGLRAALLFQSVEDVTRQAPALIAAEGERTRVAALVAIAQTRADLLARVDALTAVAQQEIRHAERTVSGDLGALAAVADARLESIQANANLHGIVIEKLVAHELARAVDGWDRVARPVGSVAAQVADAAPLFLDCDHNPDCAFNRFQGTSKAVEKAAMSFSSRFPLMLDTFQISNSQVAGLTTEFHGIGVDVHHFTTKFTAPLSTKQKIWQGVKLGAAVAGRFAP